MDSNYQADSFCEGLRGIKVFVFLLFTGFSKPPREFLTIFIYFVWEIRERSSFDFKRYYIIRSKWYLTTFNEGHAYRPYMRLRGTANVKFILRAENLLILQALGNAPRKAKHWAFISLSRKKHTPNILKFLLNTCDLDCNISLGIKRKSKTIGRS
ncbi:hypothetical protein METBIDRAFT_147362 [Metschnikowia bicuspidata var. bicuspidata NRRL YB-4993]|uniref:Uncharacterized protein n=1 Tax=Metschnikowia bicuspidata var. bicuspidata NRRL YB-4993 TaxID=869754 RepID=A0A1A0HDT9_9ASCO|nr:hypothetical protein METBIDRAFT_147362 [Metschnikowia bicuspidata var. bicuspidata NRRL YB-4993]OBA22145.1 hypothetical protein METBIDRAFT_147362 [Metschnikowia bicuspidata var. bicuspidata NRRL YB-4993]